MIAAEDVADAYAGEGASDILCRSSNMSAAMGDFLLDEVRLGNSDVDSISVISFLCEPITCDILLERRCRIPLLIGSTLVL